MDAEMMISIRAGQHAVKLIPRIMHEPPAATMDMVVLLSEL
jgi:hypothetical protein